MMKLALLTLFFIISLVHTKEKFTFSQKVQKNINRGNLYTALLDITDKYKRSRPPKEIREQLILIVEKIGPHFFNTFSDVELRNIGIPTTNLIMAKRNLYLGKYHYALKRLNKLMKNEKFQAQALLVKGTVYYKMGLIKRAISSFEKCSQIDGDSKNGLIRFHQETVQNNCRMNLGRAYFKNKEFEKAISAYNLVPKKSAKWPYTLLEKAWAYYHLENYNRVLGILLTFNSPLLESYFFPEAQALKAMSYFKLCYFEESEHIINVFYKKYKPKSSELSKLLSKRTPFQFFNLIFEDRSVLKRRSLFLNSLLTQIEKRSKHKLDLNSLFGFNSEIYKASIHSRIKDISEMQEDLKNQINHSVKLSMYNFINQIHSTSKHMFNLQLEILSKKRENLYKKKTILNKDEDGNIKNLDIGASDIFWDFRKSFWADELGDYTLALKKSCSKARR